MQKDEIMQVIQNLNTLKNSILQLNDFLLLNMQSNTYDKISIFLVNKIQEINNTVEKLNKLANLINEYNVAANTILK